MKFYKNEYNQLFVNPILKNHSGLIEITKEQFDLQLAENRKPTTEQVKQARIVELKKLLTDSDFKMMPDYDQDNSQIKIERAKWRQEIRKLEV